MSILRKVYAQSVRLCRSNPQKPYGRWDPGETLGIPAFSSQLSKHEAPQQWIQGHLQAPAQQDDCQRRCPVCCDNSHAGSLPGVVYWSIHNRLYTIQCL